MAKRIYKPQGVELEAFDRRKYLMIHEYTNKCKSNPSGEQFKELFPTSKHYLYNQSLYWFHHDLILQQDSWRKQFDPVEHWEICKFYEKAVYACEMKHSYEGDYEKLKDFELASDYVLECARDVFKSYIAVGCAVWVMGKFPSWANLFGRASDKGASKRLNQIARHLLSNKKLFEYFSHLQVDQKEIRKKKLEFSKDMLHLSAGFDEDDESDDEITVAIRRDKNLTRREYTSEANMNAWGLMSTYTGAHIDGIAFIDDAVTEDNYRSEIIQDTLYGHLTELGNITRESAVRIYIDTPYDENDAIQRKKRVFVEREKQEKKLGHDVKVFEHYSRPALELEGYETQELVDMLLTARKGSPESKLVEDAIVFKSCHTPKTLRGKYYDASNKRFFWSQYLLEIIPETDTIFKEEWLTYYGQNTAVGLAPPRSEMRVVGLIDPAGSKGRGSDKCAILVAGVDKMEITWILEAIEEKFTSKGLMDMVLNIDQVYRGIDEWYMENYGMGDEYRGLIQQIINSQGNTISIMPIHGGTGAGAKWDRIESSTWVWEMRRVRIQERHEEFIHQYKKWRRPPPAGLSDHLLDLFGYFKNMIYANTDVHSLANSALIEKDYSSINEMAKNEIKFLRKKATDQSSRAKVVCLMNWHEMTIEEVAQNIGNDGQPKCRKCGSPVWLQETNNPVYDMGMCN